MRLNPNKTHFSSALLAACILALCIFGATGLAVAETARETSPADAADAEAAGPAEESVHPMMIELHQLIDAQRVQLAELEEALEETEDVHEIIRIQREIESVKLGTEIEIFRAQIRYAQDREDSETAEMLQGIVDNIQARLDAKQARQVESAQANR
jgi:hypothetical protein